MQRRLRGGHGKLTASSSSGSRERSAHDWKQHQQQREKRQKKFETESQMPKEPRDHDGFVAGVRVRVRVRVWGSGSSTSGSSNGSNTVSRPVLFSPVGSWCVIKADDDYTHLHAFFVCPSPAPPSLPPCRCCQCWPAQQEAGQELSLPIANWLLVVRVGVAVVAAPRFAALPPGCPSCHSLLHALLLCACAQLGI